MQWIPAPFYGCMYSEGFLNYTHVPGLEDVYSYVILVQHDVGIMAQVWRYGTGVVLDGNSLL